MRYSLPVSISAYHGPGVRLLQSHSFVGDLTTLIQHPLRESTMPLPDSGGTYDCFVHAQSAISLLTLFVTVQ